jgi:hypothetical protein
MRDIELKIDNLTIKPHEIIRGQIHVGYPGRFDGVVVNVQIIGSNHLIIYKSYNNKPISQNLSRLFIDKTEIPHNLVEFTASIEFEPTESHEIKFRASIIQEHKEIESAIIFARLMP